MRKISFKASLHIKIGPDFFFYSYTIHIFLIPLTVQYSELERYGVLLYVTIKCLCASLHPYLLVIEKETQNLQKTTLS